MHIALTVDVEDYFQVEAFETVIECSQWDHLPHRVKGNTGKVLDLFAEFSLKGTFFILGWIAERYPSLVRRITEEGHEIACHGYGHRRITAMSPREFQDDIPRSRKLLQDISGQAVAGHRAPSFTITGRTLWALDALIEAGFQYDSSIFPIRHDVYGMPGAERFPHRLARQAGSIREFPPTTVAFSLLGKKVNIPVAGGGYLRLLPAACVSAAFSRLERQGMPCVLYFHPWEIDPGQPRSPASFRSRFRHYLNLATTESKLRRLFARHRFASMSSVRDEVLPDACSFGEPSVSWQCGGPCPLGRLCKGERRLAGLFPFVLGGCFSGGLRA